ncbi:MAG: hypothetical protein IKW74_01870, partial [Thermoguttaceae bacterium]|nr:hypothetical protein [Thermoguttaceae bacterium]
MLTTGFEHIVLTTLGIQKTPETSMIFWFFVGILLGSLVNFLVDHQGWIRRYRSPWSRLPEEFRPLFKRRFSDFIPVWGWIAMIRYNRILFPAERASEQTSPKSASPTSSKKYTEKSCQKKPVDSLTSNSPAGVPGMETPFFWVPPFLVELGFGLFLAWYQAGSHLLTFSFIQGQTPLYCPTFNGLMIFFFVMILTASLTDLLDYVIPDTFMILGTLIGIFFATIFPGTNFHHSVCFHSLMKFYLGDISSGLHWNPVHNSLALNLIFLAWTFWCFAMLDRRFYLRLPPKKRYALFFRTLARSGMTIPLVIIWLAGLGFI